ncbi:hypothetical protein Tco_1368867 [Tanacetum coccineum]
MGRISLSKPAESEGFEQIVDFLNAHPIKHALTVNPTIYTSCIEQFWATVKAKTVNGEVQLQALVDGKKIIITESTVRRDLQLEDAEGVDCLPNATIFEQLALMGYEQNEFSSTMASVIICLATNQKFNFSKYIFESMVKNLDNVGKFLMYLRNMRRVGKGFSRRETPLFQTMVVQAQAEIGKGSANPTDPHHTPTFIQPSTSQPQKKQKLRKPKRKDTQIPQSSGPTKHSRADSGNITKNQSRQTPNEAVPKNYFKVVVPSAKKPWGIQLLKLDDANMFDVNTLTGDEVLAEQEVAAKDVNLTVDEVTLAQALAALKSVKPKVKVNVVEEPSVPVSAASTKVSAATTITTATILTLRKGIVITKLEKPMKSMTKKDLVRLDEEIASKLQAKFDEEERLAREKDEANVALTEE